MKPFTYTAQNKYQIQWAYNFVQYLFQRKYPKEQISILIMHTCLKFSISPYCFYTIMRALSTAITITNIRFNSKNHLSDAEDEKKGKINSMYTRSLRGNYHKTIL